MNSWGIDLGGTKIECGVFEIANDMRAITRRRIPTEANKGYDHILLQVKKLVKQVSEEIGDHPDRIGFATPGVLEPDTQVMKNCNTTCMNGNPMQKDLERILDVEVKLANDANCFALAETLMGVGKEHPGAEVVFGVIMGTGVGGGLVVHKKIITGRHGIAGEWGHNVLEENGEECYCGKRGCVEKVIAGPALEDFYFQQSGERLTLKQIVLKHHTGHDSAASATMERLV